MMNLDRFSRPLSFERRNRRIHPDIVEELKRKKDIEKVMDFIDEYANKKGILPQVEDIIDVLDVSLDEKEIEELIDFNGG